MNKCSAGIPARFCNIIFYIMLTGTLLAGCATTRPAPPPKLPLENPLAGLNAPADPVFQKGYLRYQKGEYIKSREQFQKKISTSPDHYPSYLAIGYTHLAENNLDLGEKYVRKSIELNPDYAQAYWALGYLQEQRQNYDAAISALNEVARINPEYPLLSQQRNILKLKATEMHLNQARQLKAIDPQEALRHLKVAQELAPDLAAIPEEMADIFLQQNDCASAVEHLEVLLKNSPDDVSLKKKLAACFEDLNQLERALMLFEELSVATPADSEIRNHIDQLKKKIFVASLPAEYHAIPEATQVTRAQFAAFIMNNLEFLKQYAPGTSQIITDTIHHWAKSFIQQSVDLGVIDLFPNRTFQPNRSITRLELAKAASRIVEILEMTRNRSFSSPETVVIPDVSTGNVYYSMIAKVVSSNVVSLDTDGRFHPTRPVSGAEAISVVNRLKAMTN